jgi:threonine dehydratase
VSRRESEPADATVVGLHEVEAAARRLAGVALRTPLLPFGAGGHRAFLKVESLQPIGSFKIRGAYNALAQLSPEARARGVVAHSSGNHAQGVSRAARLLGIAAVVVMPASAPRIKIDAVRADGARIVVVGDTDEERVAVARRLAERDGLSLIPSFDDARIVAGQGTLGLEIVDQLGEAAADRVEPSLGDADPGGPRAAPPLVVVPVGGGGLAAGVCVALKGRWPGSRVVGVEPELAADARDSLREGRIVRWDASLTARTIADGVRTSAVGRIPFAHLRDRLDAVVTVSEDEIARAMVRCARQARLVVEPSGALSVAALLFRDLSETLGEREPLRGPIVAVVSGGNVDGEAFRGLIEAGEAAGG